MVGQSEGVKILFLAANPNGTERRRLDEEIRRIELALERAKRREQFKIIQKWAVTDDDLRRALLDHEPEVVHFSGHGGGSQGLAFVDSQGRLQIISGESLARLFELCADHVRCVILNACFSEIQARVISRHVEIVVGMSQEIGDDASIKFSEGFYDALGAGRDFEKAFKFGCIAIDLRSLQEHLVPIILRNPEIRRLARVSAQGDGPIRIVPRGLRSFQTEDSDFFLELLPGPRGHDGLPTSLRFWKTRIEERNPDRTFPVGLIYGPSGCGKSSLVKAGLLPRLSDTIQPVLVEATADDTETRLLKGLRVAFPGLKNDLNLIDTFITLRRETEATGRKTLIVIDQFEQWLHAKTEEEKSGLALALRLCDGANIQCIVMIRDDFWVSNKRFMNDVSVPISDGENAALVDLFDMRHARKVLGLFADAYGVWENSPVEPTERAQFLDDAVSGLAEDDRVICVRIALFCELFQGKPWDLKTLEKVGGVEGVGVLFMEETFSADNAPAENRYHQKAVRAVLNALLPEPGSKIKGRMRSDRDLMDVSRYADRPDDFQALVRILDEKTHLITPTDPEGLGAKERGVKEPSAGRFYQLTHDYLVPSIRDWLTRKQKETRRGRAELLLADRSSLWNAKPENRQLPSALEWAKIRLLTRRRDWSEPQSRMMKRAGRVHGVRGLTLAAVLLLLVCGVYEVNGWFRAQMLRDKLLASPLAEVPGIITELKPYRTWVDPLLRQAYAEAKEAGDSQKQLHAALALLPVDDTQLPYLRDRLLGADAQDISVIRQLLAGHKDALVAECWRVLDKPIQEDRRKALQAASALALYDPENPLWEKVNIDVANRLVVENAYVIAKWVDALHPVSKQLRDPLIDVFHDVKRGESERTQAASTLGEYLSEQPNELAGLLMDATEKQFAALYPSVERRSEQTAPLLEVELSTKPPSITEVIPTDVDNKALNRFYKRQANAATALIRMGRAEKSWSLLKHSPDPSLRSYLLHRLGPLGVEPGLLIAKLDQKSDVSIRRALILSLGECEKGRLRSDDRIDWTTKLLNLYRNDPDPGIHGASEWLLRQWGNENQIQVVEKELAKLPVPTLQVGEGKPSSPGNIRRWYVNSQGQTMVVVRGPVEFEMGEKNYQHRENIGHNFAIASKKVTVEQFETFLKENPRVQVKDNKLYSPEPTCPMNTVSWYKAAAYCNWLSKHEGLPEDQWCYAPNEKGDYAEGMKLMSTPEKRKGYRLPTEAEWEYSCRAGSVTGYYFGEPWELLGKYGWYIKNSDNGAQRVGSLKPNDLGLFDLHGNIFEWCQDRYKEPGKENNGNDINIQVTINYTDPRILRGGTFGSPPALVRSALRYGSAPAYRYFNLGFRPSRTYP